MYDTCIAQGKSLDNESTVRVHVNYLKKKTLYRGIMFCQFELNYVSALRFPLSSFFRSRKEVL